MKKMKVKLSGLGQILLHNNQMLIPKNYYKLEFDKVKNKKPKTEADLERLANIEFLAGLYLDDNVVVIPIKMQLATFIKGAMKDKKGPVAKAGVYFDKNSPLIFDGDGMTPEELYEDGDFTSTEIVRVGMSSVPRVRPIFPNWSVDIEMTYDEDIIDDDVILQAWRRAGQLIGMGDWRPRYGRFTVKQL